jgi:hypothetical protein
MSKLKKRLWMGTSVVVALAVVVAAVYAGTDYVGSLTTDSAGGIGMDTDEPNDPTVMEWEWGQFLEGSLVGTSPNEIRCLEIGAPVGTSDGGQVRIFVNDGSDGAAAVAHEDQAFLHAYSTYGWVPHASVGADWDGNAWIKSVDGGSSVEATDGGDVIITLGS